MGESARRPGCPELAATPLELLTPRPGEGFSAFQTYIWPACGALSGIGGVTFINVILRRPKWSGLPLHFLAAAAGYLGFSWIRDKRYEARAEDDAVLKHYISLHPEDFPPFDRKRWRDVYHRFEPYR